MAETERRQKRSPSRAAMRCDATLSLSSLGLDMSRFYRFRCLGNAKNVVWISQNEPLKWRRVPCKRERERERGVRGGKKSPSWRIQNQERRTPSLRAFCTVLYFGRRDTESSQGTSISFWSFILWSIFQSPRQSQLPAPSFSLSFSFSSSNFSCSLLHVHVSSGLV